VGADARPPVCSLVVFTALPAAAFALRCRPRVRRTGEPGWARSSAVSGVALPLGFVLVVLAFNTARRSMALRAGPDAAR
jgi:hypothetical protein